jgi:hypothetical protein
MDSSRGTFNLFLELGTTFLRPAVARRKLAEIIPTFGTSIPGVAFSVNT